MRAYVRCSVLLSRAAFSAGTFEEGRLDSDDFESDWLGGGVEDGFEGERWLNITAEVQPNAGQLASVRVLLPVALCLASLGWCVSGMARSVTQKAYEALARRI